MAKKSFIGPSIPKLAYHIHYNRVYFLKSVLCSRSSTPSQTNTGLLVRMWLRDNFIINPAFHFIEYLISKNRRNWINFDDYWIMMLYVRQKKKAAKFEFNASTFSDFFLNSCWNSVYKPHAPPTSSFRLFEAGVLY